MKPTVPLNVLSNAARMDQEDIINQVHSMIDSSNYNRAERKQLVKALKKTNKLSEKAQTKLDHSAKEEYHALLEQDFIHFFAALAITMKQRYYWREDENNDQISSLLESVEKTLEKYSNLNYTTEDLAKLAEEETGIELRTK